MEGTRGLMWLETSTLRTPQSTSGSTPPPSRTPPMEPSAQPPASSPISVARVTRTGILRSRRTGVLENPGGFSSGRKCLISSTIRSSMPRSLEVSHTPAATPTPKPVVPQVWDKLQTPFPLEPYNSQGNFIGDSWLKTLCTVLMLLAIPASGFGQQDPAAKYAAVVAAAQEAMGRSDFKAAAEDYQQAVKMRPGSAEMW